MSILLYRLVKHNPPLHEDMYSYKLLGIPLLAVSESRLWDGLSCYNTESQARRRARSLHGYRFIAVLEIPEDGNVRYERTGRDRGHYTIWADVEVLLRAVQQVIPLEERM